MTPRIGHDRCVNEAQIEIREPEIDCGGPPEQPLRKKDDGVFPGRDGLQESRRGVLAQARPKQLIDLHKHEVRDQEAKAQLRHQCGCQPMGPR